MNREQKQLTRPKKAQVRFRSLAASVEIPPDALGFNKSPNAESYSDLAIIVVAWLLLPSIMALLQVLGFNFGFNVWPTGEIRNWLTFLQDGHGVDAAKLFWKLDNRNALSPWWYLATQTLIAKQDSAFLILHLVAGLFTGVSSYLMITEVTRTRARIFALSAGCISALFLANIYLDEIIWNMIGALVCSLLSVWSFARYLNGTSRITAWYGASLVFWSLAISTYTIQCGAAAAIFVVSLHQRLRMASAQPAAFLGVVLSSVADVAPYIALLTIYIMTWITTSSMGSFGLGILHFSVQQLAQSITFGLWPSDLKIFWMWLSISGEALMLCIFLSTASVLILLFNAQRIKANEPIPIKMADLALVLLVGFCLVMPTIALESSSALWIPGSRWPMVMQFWTPLFFCGAFALISGIVQLNPFVRLWTWRIGTSAAGALAIVLSLGFNHTQIIHTRTEKQFFTNLTSFVAGERAIGKKFPRYYLVRLDVPTVFLAQKFIEDAYARTILGSDVYFRLIASNSLPPRDDQITFADLGVGNVTSDGSLIKYDQVSVLSWDGKQFTLVTSVNRSTFANFQAEWRASRSVVESE